MASLNRFEGIPARPALLEADITRMVSELTRDVEQFDSLVYRQRRLLRRRTTDVTKAEQQWREMRAQVGIIRHKVHAILDEIDLPVAHN